VPEREDNRLQSGACFQLAHGRGEHLVNFIHGQPQFCRDFAQVRPARRYGQDVALAPGQGEPRTRVC
jgi:hypothetical protein